MENILIFGAGGHGKVIVDIVEKQGVYQILGILDPNKKPGELFCGYPVLGGDETVGRHASKASRGIIAVGENSIRARVTKHVSEIHPAFAFVSAVHPSAVLGKDVAIGPGSVVMAGVVINSGSRIGSHCVLNTRCSLDHDGLLGDFAQIAPGATLGGNVRVGEHAFVGLGASVIHEKKIGEHAVVGAGAVVIRDVPSYSVAVGVPARVIKRAV
jgi:sugar O-acyltransferase (sialic acid O-acetyltransferase NeuD family)